MQYESLYKDLESRAFSLLFAGHCPEIREKDRITFGLNLTPKVLINIDLQILGYRLEGYIYASKILVLGLKTYFYHGLLCKALWSTSSN